MKTTMQRYRRLLGLSLLAVGLGTLNTLAGDVTADNVTVNHDLTVINPGAGSAPTNGLILYYSFSTNTTPVVDDSGNNHTGTVSGATWVTNGITGGGYGLDGSNDYMTVTGYKGILGNNPSSVSLWFKWNTAFGQTYAVLTDWGDDAAIGGCHVIMIYPASHNHILGGFAGDGKWLVSDTPASALLDGNWHQVAMTFDGDSGKLYIDGTLDVSLVIGSINVLSTDDVKIGIYRDNSQYPFPGVLDELRIYNRALSPTEVSDLYLHDAHLTAGSSTFQTDVTCEKGVKYLKPLGDIPMGVYTNDP